jgi:hypothetical protein
VVVGPCTRGLDALEPIWDTLYPTACHLLRYARLLLMNLPRALCVAQQERLSNRNIDIDAMV